VPAGAPLPLSGFYRATGMGPHDACLEFGLGGKMAENRGDDLETEAQRQERREFLKRCGRFAAVTPPAMATLLVVFSVPKEAHASTIGAPPVG